MSRLAPPAPPCREASRFNAKICPRDEAAERIARLPRPLVFTNGVFDLLHRGHVESLDQAARLGQGLVVGLNSDRSAAALGKGPGRPINPAEDRAVVLAALASVSLVVIFDEPTPLALLEELRPDVYVKGGDYQIEDLPEAQRVACWGGRTVILSYLAGRSTTAMIERATLSATGRPT